MAEKDVYKKIVETIAKDEKFMDFNLEFAKKLDKNQLEEYSAAVAQDGTPGMMFELLENVENSSYNILIDGICNKGDLCFVSAITEYAIENDLPIDRLSQAMFEIEKNLNGDKLRNASGLDRFYQVIEWLEEREGLEND